MSTTWTGRCPECDGGVAHAATCSTLPDSTPEARRRGTEWDGDTEVPCYEPRRGCSVDQAADSLNLRVLARRDAAPAMAIIIDESGTHFRCAR